MPIYAILIFVNVIFVFGILFGRSTQVSKIQEVEKKLQIKEALFEEVCK